jgi:hypothetical protein
MKTQLLLFSLLILGMISCKTATKNNALNTVEKTFWINSAKLPCQGVGPMSCLQVQDGEKIEEGRWQNFFSNIEGFEYEPGNIYKIVVAVEQLPPPIPADASSLRYRLVKVISKTADKTLAITDIWLVEKVGEYEKPKGMGDKSLTFEFNASERRMFGFLGLQYLARSNHKTDGNGTRIRQPRKHDDGLRPSQYGAGAGGVQCLFPNKKIQAGRHAPDADRRRQRSADGATKSRLMP